MIEDHRRAEEGSGGKNATVRRAYDNLITTTRKLMGREHHMASYSQYFFTEWWPALNVFHMLTKYEHGDEAMNKRFEELGKTLAEHRRTMMNPLPNLGYTDQSAVQGFWNTTLEARKLAEEYAYLID